MTPLTIMLKRLGSPATFEEFPREEYDLRCDRARKLMDEFGFDALFITEEKNYFYLSGHSTLQHQCKTRPLILIMPKKSEPVLMISSSQKLGAGRASWIEDIRTLDVVPYDPVGPLENTLKEIGLDDANMGAELGSEQRLCMPFNDFTRLKAALPKANFLDASQLLLKLRMIKSQWEIERMRTNCQITSRAIEGCFDRVKEGMTERDVAKILAMCMLEEGADRLAFLLFDGSYSGYPADRVFRTGDTLAIDTGSVYRGYWSDFGRMAVFGKPSHKQEQMNKLTWDINQKCIDTLKPGVKLSEVAAACLKEYKKRVPEGYVKGRLGHGMGLDLGEPPSIALSDTTVLQPGMVLAVEVCRVFSDYGFFEPEENVAITPDGCEVLSTASRGLRTL
jgi:Xaa-Pro aminopeptidase